MFNSGKVLLVLILDLDLKRIYSWFSKYKVFYKENVSNYLSGDLVVRWSEQESNLLGESG